MRNVLFAALVFAIPVAALAAPPRLPDDIRVQSSRPSNVERVEVPKVDQVVKTDSIRPERIPEAVKHLIRIDLCTSAQARCD